MMDGVYMKIAIINPPYMMEKISKTGMPSIGQGYISAFLEKNGIENDLFDFSYSSANISELIDNNKLLDYDILGIASYTISFLKTVDFISEIKKRKKEMVIWVGGHHASLAPKIILDDFKEIDYLIIGYGENSVYELIQALKGIKRLEDVKGLVYRNEGKIHINQPYFQYNLDSLPFPRRWILNENNQKRNTIVNDTLSISTSRGCPYNCFYCVNSIKKSWQCRTAGNVLQEIRQIARNNTFKELYFVDCNFFVDVKRAIDLLEQIHQEFPDISFNIQMRCDQVVNNEWAIAKLSNINCRTINIGVESNSQNVLNRFNKLTTPEINQKSIDILKKYHINTVTYFIMFEALMNMDDLECNISFIEKNDLITIYNMENVFNTLMPFVGTPYYEKYGKYYEGSIHALMRPIFQDEGVRKAYKFIKEFRDEFEDSLIIYLEELIDLRRKKMHDIEQYEAFCDILIKINFTVLKIVSKEIREGKKEINYESIIMKYGIRKLVNRIKKFIDIQKERDREEK